MGGELGLGSVMDIIHAGAEALNIPRTQVELAIGALALAMDSQVRKYDARALAEMKDWTTLATILLEDAELLDNAFLVPGLLERKPIAEALSEGFHAKNGRVESKSNGKGMARKNKGKGKAHYADDAEQNVIPCSLGAEDDLSSIFPGLLKAHRACQKRYFKTLQLDEKEKVAYKLSRQEEGKLDGIQELGSEMRSAGWGK